MVKLDWLEENMTMKEQLNYVIMTCGGKYLIMAGQWKMQKLSVGT